jgi:hypothetical protein
MDKAIEVAMKTIDDQKQLKQEVEATVKEIKEVEPSKD